MQKIQIGLEIRGNVQIIASQLLQKLVGFHALRQMILSYTCNGNENRTWYIENSKSWALR